MLLHKEFYADVPRISRDRNLIREEVGDKNLPIHFFPFGEKISPLEKNILRIRLRDRLQR